MGFSGQNIVKCAKKNAILGILHKFQTAVPPKVLGIRANPWNPHDIKIQQVLMLPVSETN